MQKRQIKTGFSFLEMGIVIIIVGLIMAVAMPLLVDNVKKRATQKGQLAIDELVREIVGFAMNEKAKGAPPTLPANLNQLSGAVDLWNNTVNYYPASGMTTDICAVNTTGLTYQLQENATTTRTVNNVAFIVVSSGANTKIESDTLTASGGDFSGTFSDKSASHYNETLADSAGTGQYDDLVRHVTLDFLKSKLCLAKGEENIGGDVIAFETDGIANIISGSAGFNTYLAGDSGAVKVNSADDTLTLGNDKNDATACIWYDSDSLLNYCKRTAGPSSPVVCTHDSWTRQNYVFRFKTKFQEDPNLKSGHAGGFVFAIINGTQLGNRNEGEYTTVPCGGGAGSEASYLGYASDTAASEKRNVIEPPKFGVEVDIYKDTGRDDPDPGNSKNKGYNHIAAIYWYFPDLTKRAGDNVHGKDNSVKPRPQDTGYPAYAQEAPGFNGLIQQQNKGKNNAVNEKGMLSVDAEGRLMWMEDAKEYWVRIEFSRDNTKTAHVDEDVIYKTEVWVWDGAVASDAFQDVTTSMTLTGSLGVNYHYFTSYETKWHLTEDLFDEDGDTSTAAKYNMNEMMNNFRFGWTMATGDNTGINTFIINKFAFSLQ